MRFLVVLAAATVAYAGNAVVPLQVTDAKCFTAETSCKDFYTASQCGTIKECIPKWEKLPTNLSKPTELCKLCMEMVKEARDQLLSNETQTELLQVLDGSCDILVPTQTLKEACKKLVVSFVDELDDILVSRMDPGQVCTVSGLCYDKDNSQILSEFRKFVIAKSQTCEQCKTTIKQIQEVLESVAEDTIIDAFLALCKYFNFADNKCHNFASLYVTKTLRMLKSQTPEKTCQILGRCPGGKTDLKSVFATVLAPKEDIQCEFCEAMIHKVAVQLNNPTSKDQIRSVLKAICAKTGSWKAECLSKVQNDFDAAFNELIALLDGNVICKMVGLCPAVQRSSQLLGKSKTYRAVSLTEGPCDYCRTVAQYVQDAIGNDRTKDRIEAVLEKLCYIIPVDSGKCQQYIDDNLDNLYNLLRQNLTVDEICQTLRLCSIGQSERKVPSYRKPQMPTSDESCSLCNVVSSWVLDELKDNKSEQAILHMLERGCQRLPVDKQQCKNIIDVYGSIIIEYIQKDYNSEQICEAIRLCTPKRPAPSEGTTCELCTLASGWLLDELKDNRSVRAIESAVERMCNVLPGDSSKCREFVESYGDRLIALIESDVTAQEICAALRLCSSKSVERVLGDSCPLCKILAETLIDKLKENKTVAAIEKALEKVCKVLPVNQTKCQNLVDRYSEELMELLQKELTPTEICAALGLCPKSELSPPAATSTESCTVCRLVVDTLLSKIGTNKTEAQILEALEKVCHVVPNRYKNQCDDYVKVYGDKLIKLILIYENSDSICKELQLCAQPERLRKTDFCPFCQIWVNVVEAELRNNGTRAEIEKILDKACGMLPSDDQHLCRNMVDVYTEYVIEMIENLSTPEEICQTINVCPTPPTNLKCEVCEFITNYAESQLSNNRTKEEIEQLLSKVCSVMPQSNVAQCRATTQQYSDMIISLLIQLVPPRRICEEIKLCPVVNVRQIALPKAKRDEKCSFCKWLVTWVDQKLLDNRTEDAIKDELDKACGLLDDSVKCRAMVSDYVDTIVKMLVSYATPEKVCEEIGKCPKATSNLQPSCGYCRNAVTALDENRRKIGNSESKAKATLNQMCLGFPHKKSDCEAFVDKNANDVSRLFLTSILPERICETLRLCKPTVQMISAEPCGQCKSIVNYIADEVKDKTVDERIVEVVERVCSAVPHAYRANCEDLVQTKGMVIVRMLAQSISPERVCEAIKFCPVDGSLVCTWCEYSLHFVQTKLYENRTEMQVIQELDKICSELPSSSMVSECKEFVETYGPSIEVLVAQKLDPSIICPAIHACPARKNLLSSSATAKCDECVNAMQAFHSKPTDFCIGANSQFAKCRKAVEIGAHVVRTFGDFKLCEFAGRCGILKGEFRCNSAGCRLL